MADIDTCALDAGISVSELKQMAQAMGGELDDTNVKDILAKRKQDAAWQSRSTRLNMQANARTAKQVMPNLEAGMRPKEAVKAILVRDLKDKSGMVSLDQLAAGYQAAWNTRLVKAAELFKPTITGGQRNVDLLKDAVRVAAGGTGRSGDANDIGTAMRQTFEAAHKSLTDAGADVGKIVNYFPQTHVRGKLQKAGKDEWRDFVLPLLDRAKMLDDNGNQLSDADLIKLMDFVYESITTQGRNKLEGKVPPALKRRLGGRMGVKSSMSRVLHFNNGDDFIKYNDRFGDEDLWGTMTNSLHSMAVDTALHKTFGADPQKGFETWKTWAQRQDTSMDVASIDAIWDNIVGFDHHGDTPVSQIANAGRDLLSAAYMGTAVWSSIPDLSIAGLNAAMNDMGVGRMFAQMMDYNEISRAKLGQAVGLIDYANSAMAMSPRFEESWGKMAPRRWADANYRLSGMTGWVNRLRHAWMGEMQLTLGANRNKSFDKLPQGIKSFLETYGLEGDWDTIRKAGTDSYRGGEMMMFGTLEDTDLVARVLGAIYTERDLAVLHPDARTRAALNQGLAPGSAGGEIIRAMNQFKTFPATMMMHSIYRYVFTNRLDKMTRAKYMMSSAIAMTMLGYISLQAKEILKGREPRTDTDSPDLWLRAFAQGGAVPGLAELVLDGQTRHGSGWVESLAGPTGAMLSTGAGSLWSAGELVFGVDGADSRFGRNIEAATQMVPGQSLWYARLGVQRLLRDEILDIVDPTYGDRQLRRERQRETDTGQEDWWGFE